MKKCHSSLLRCKICCSQRGEIQLQYAHVHRNIPNDEILRPETVVRSNTEKYYDIAFRLDGDVSEGASERSSKRADRVTFSSSPGKRE